MGQDDKGWSVLVTPLVDQTEEWWVAVMDVGLDPELSKMIRVLGSGCHRGRPLIGFPWFSLQPKRPRVSLFGMVPAGLEPSTGLLGLVGYLGVVSWSMG